MKFLVINGHRNPATAIIEKMHRGDWVRLGSRRMPAFTQAEVEIPGVRFVNQVRVTSEPAGVVTLHSEDELKQGKSGGDK